MTNPYRAMIARMADELDHYRQLLMDDRREAHALATEARALLAQPVAEGPTDEEIADWHGQCVDLTRLREADQYWAFDLRSDEVAGVVRAALARWGRPTPQPVAVSERLPGAEDCDEQGLCWLWERDCGYNGRKWALVDRAWALRQSDEDLSVYTHWLPANALPTPEALDD